jgi:hypothetical protein
MDGSDSAPRLCIDGHPAANPGPHIDLRLFTLKSLRSTVIVRGSPKNIWMINHASPLPLR